MARNDDYNFKEVKYGKQFEKDSSFKDILNDTSIEDPVKITKVHKDINSLSAMLSRSQMETKKELKGITTQLNSTAKKQDQLVSKIRMRDMSSSREVKAVEKSVQQVMGKLGYAVDEISKGSKKILMTTAITTKETLKQYGAAISGDFSINKSNFMAMTLAKASPIFGYFAAKFMETEIFKKAAEKIKSMLTAAVMFSFNKIKDLFGRGKERVKDWYSKRKEAKKQKKENTDMPKVPKMAKGGYVKKEGMAHLHPAEVVSPIGDLSKELAKAMEPTKNAIIKELRGLRYATVGMSRDLSAAFSLTLLKNPMFKSLRGTFDSMRKAYNVAKFFFGKRNKYSAMLSKDPNPLARTADNIGIFFSNAMFKLDIIISHLAEMVYGITGHKPSAPKVETWSRFEKIKGIVSDVKKGKTKGILDRINKDVFETREEDRSVMENVKKALTELTSSDKFKSMSGNISEKVLTSKNENAPEQGSLDLKESKLQKGKNLVSSFTKSFKEEGTKEATKISPIQQKIKDKLFGGEKKPAGPEQGSFDFAESHKTPEQKLEESFYKKGLEFFKLEKKTAPEDSNYFKKMTKQTLLTEEHTRDISKHTKKGFSSIGTFAMMLFGLLSSLPALLMKGLFGAKDLIGKGLGLASTVGKGMLGGGAGAGGAGAAGGVAKKGGRFRRGIGNLGRSNVGMAGGAIGGAMGIMDAATGYAKKDEWGTSGVSAAIGGALGGTESGVKGAMSGAIKGGGIGSMIGSMVLPGIGTAIGGAIGAIAGGIMGFVGGENIAKGLDSIWDKAKNLVSSIGDMLMYPFKVLSGLKDKFMAYWKDPEKSLYDKVAGAATEVLKVVSWPSRMMIGLSASLLQYLYDAIPGFLKKLIPDFILKGVEGTLASIKAYSNFDITGGNAAVSKTISDVGSSATSFSNKAVAVINSGSKGDSGIQSFEDGGIVPPAPGGGLDGRGGQLAIVHEGEQVIPRSVVEKAQKTGQVPPEEVAGNSIPEMIDSIMDQLGSGVSNIAGSIGGTFKAGYEKIKEALGPSSGFGWLSRLFESAGAGAGAIGWDSTGGSSYGYYQLAEKKGTPQKFISGAPEKISKAFAGLSPGTQEFNEKWKQLAATDPSFGQAQHDFIKQKYLNPYMDKIKNDTGLDLTTKSPVVSEEVLSTAVQYGPASSVIPKALAGAPLSITDEEIIKKIGEYKYNNVSSNFKSSTPAIQQAVANRIQRETSIALGALGTGQGVDPNSLPKAKEGGVITADGPIYAHAGEVIGPITEVKDSILKALLSKNEVANIQSNKDYLTANMLNQGAKNMQAGAMDTLSKQNQNSNIIMSNMGNTISSSMNNLSKSIKGGDSKNNSKQGNDEIQNILSGNLF